MGVPSASLPPLRGSASSSPPEEQGSPQQVCPLMDLPSAGLTFWQVAPLRRTHPSLLFPSQQVCPLMGLPSPSLFPRQVSPQWDLCPHGLPLIEALLSRVFTPKPPCSGTLLPTSIPRQREGWNDHNTHPPFPHRPRQCSVVRT